MPFAMLFEEQAASCFCFCEGPVRQTLPVYTAADAGFFSSHYFISLVEEV